VEYGEPDGDPEPMIAEVAYDVADGEPKRLDPNFIPAETLSGWIATAVISGVSLVVLAVLGVTGVLALWLVVVLGVAWVALTALLVWVTPRWPRWEYDTTSYVVRPDGVEIRRGIFWKEIVNVPRSRVQHTDVSQGPIMRRYGIAALTMYTAGTQHAAVGLGGLTHGTALRIRDFLIHGGEGDAV
jgi:membrane protein YdbS with pleckstrin-like domain